MTDAEFKSLRPGDKISVDGEEFSFNAVVIGSHTYDGKIPVRIVWVSRIPPPAAYSDYRPGYLTSEENRGRLQRGWI